MPFDNPFDALSGDMQILLTARNMVSWPERWVQCRYRDGDRNCLVAALSVACDSPDFYRPNHTEHRFARLLAKQLPRGPYWVCLLGITARRRLMLFNDHPHTRHEDVLALLDRVIELLPRRTTRRIPTGASQTSAS